MAKKISTNGRFPERAERAIYYRTIKALSILDACKLAGISPPTYYRWRDTPKGLEIERLWRERAIADAQTEMALAQAQAIQHGRQLMLNAKSESVQARLVELFVKPQLPDAGQHHLVVHQFQKKTQAEPEGYQYARPGQRVVEIEHKPALEMPEISDTKERVSGEGGENP